MVAPSRNFSDSTRRPAGTIGRSVDVIIDDAKAYMKPWTARLHQILVPDSELIDYHCNENEKDTVHVGDR